MKTVKGNLAAPFPWFGGKSLACNEVWAALGDPKNYVEPFAGSAAMLLGRPTQGDIETINDADGFVANFWRAVSMDPDATAIFADWPVNEVDLFARHSWLVRQSAPLLDKLHADPEFFDPKIAGWWCWGACNWIGSGWCSGDGPWVHDGERIVDSRQLPHLGNAGRGINRQLPHLSAGQGINRKLDDAREGARRDYIFEWFRALRDRTRNVRVAAGDWSRVLADSVTIRHGLTGVFLDPPYTKGDMDYSAKGTGGVLASSVRDWCKENGDNPKLRIVLCGHAGEHDDLLSKGWRTRSWTAKKGYALTDAAKENSKSETLWCSPHCIKNTTTPTTLL
jgi:site-specific DNA-adenine methylase